LVDETGKKRLGMKVSASSHLNRFV
jgi:hypothetical protein